MRCFSNILASDPVLPGDAAGSGPAPPVRGRGHRRGVDRRPRGVRRRLLQRRPQEAHARRLPVLRRAARPRRRRRLHRRQVRRMVVNVCQRGANSSSMIKGA